MELTTAPPHEHKEGGQPGETPPRKIIFNEGNRIEAWQRVWNSFKETNSACLTAEDPGVVIYGGPTPVDSDSEASARSGRWTQAFLHDKYFNELPVSYECKSGEALWGPHPPKDLEQKQRLRSALVERLTAAEFTLDKDKSMPEATGAEGGCDTIFSSDVDYTELLPARAGEISTWSADGASSTAETVPSRSRLYRSMRDLLQALTY